MKSLALVLLFAGCSSIAVQDYKAGTPLAISSSYSAGTVAGQTTTESDQLVKASLPCRMTTFSMPNNESVSDYISNAMKSELVAAGKFSENAPRVDITIMKLESDTEKIHNGRWTLDFKYTVGKTTREVVTTKDYGASKDSNIACHNTAAAFDDALRDNFAKYFSGQ